MCAVDESACSAKKGERRRLGRGFLAATGLAVAAGLFSVLAWGMIKSGGQPGGLVVNSKLGEVSVREKLAPDFTLQMFDGGRLTLSELRGKVVMVDFWASWCPPCRREAPVLAAVYQEYKDKGVEFIGVDIWDNRDEALKYVDRYGITYSNGLDEKGRIAIDYGVTGIPEKYFISRDGVVLRKFIGPMDEDRLKEVLDTLLNP